MTTRRGFLAACAAAIVGRKLPVPTETPWDNLSGSTYPRWDATCSGTGRQLTMGDIDRLNMTISAQARKKLEWRQLTFRVYMYGEDI